MVSNISTSTNKNKQPPLKTNNHLSKQTTTSQNKQPPLKTNNHLSKQTTTSQNKQPPFKTNNHLSKQTTTSHSNYWRDRRGRDRKVVGFTTTSAISAYHH